MRPRAAIAGTWAPAVDAAGQPLPARAAHAASELIHQFHHSHPRRRIGQESDAGPPRKYYKLTAKGKAQLDELNEYWTYINQTLDNVGRA